MATSAQVQQLYIALLGRAADKPGLDWWLENINGGERTLEEAAAAFTTSEEYVATYGSLQGAELVTAVYSNLFERTPSEEEVAYWVNDGRPADQLLAAFLTYASPADKQVIDNKVLVAETYTKVAGGTDFNKASAADVIADVDGTLGSVSAALGKLANGQLDGQVPGAAQLQAQAAAVAALASYEKLVATDATLSKLFTAVDLADGQVTKAEADSALTNAEAARTTVSIKSTGVLGAEATDAANAATAAFNALDVAGKTAANKWLAAVAAADAAKAADVTAVAGVKASLDADSTFTAGLKAADAVITGETFATANDLYAFYIDPASSDADRALIDTAFANVNTFASFKATAVIDLADAKAGAAVVAAEAALTTAGGAAFINATNNKTTADTLLANAQKADQAVEAVKAVADQFAALDKAVTDAGTALTNALTAANANKVDLGALADASTTPADANKSDVFLFETAIDTDDFIISGFGQGTSGFDYLVLGQGYTFNSGALSTGNNSALEFFLVQKGADTQVVVETEAWGNASSTVDTNGVVTASPDASVITLTGVTVDQLQVSNGVISFVA